MCSYDNICMNEIEKRKQLMQTWKELPEPRVDWETFKRIAARNRSLTGAVHQAIKLAKKG